MLLRRNLDSTKLRERKSSVMGNGKCGRLREGEREGKFVKRNMN